MTPPATFSRDPSRTVRISGEDTCHSRRPCRRCVVPKWLAGVASRPLVVVEHPRGDRPGVVAGDIVGGGPQADPPAEMPETAAGDIRPARLAAVFRPAQPAAGPIRAEDSAATGRVTMQRHSLRGVRKIEVGLSYEQLSQVSA